MTTVRVPLCSFANGLVRLFVTFNEVTQVVSQIDVENDSTGDSQDGQGNQQDAVFHIKNPSTGNREEHRLSGSSNKNVSSIGFKRPKPGVQLGEGIGSRWPG